MISKVLRNCFIICFGITIALVTIWFRTGHILATGETGLVFYDAHMQAALVKHTWSESTIGMPNSIGIGSYPLLWVFSALQSIQIPGFLIQAGFFAILLWTSQFGIILLVRETITQTLKLKDSYTLYVSAAMFYTLNTIAIIGVWNRFQYSFMLLYSILPLTVFLFIRGIHIRKIRYAVYTNGVLLCAAYSLSSLVYSLLLWFILGCITIFFVFIGRDNRKLSIWIIGYFVASVIIWMLTNLWWIVPFVITITTTTYITTQAYSSSGNLNTFLSLSGRLGDLTYIFRLLNKEFINTDDLQLWPFLNNQFVRALTFIPIILVVHSLSYLRKSPYIAYYFTMSMFLIFLSKGANDPFGQPFQFLFSNIRIFEAYRNPFEKFSMLIPLFMTPLIAISLYSIAQSKKNSFVRYSVLTIIGMVAFIVLPLPMWSGLVFSSNIEPANRAEIGYRVSVPENYRQLSNHVLQQGISRNIVLPMSTEGITHTWDYGYSGVELSNGLFANPSISFVTFREFLEPLATQAESLLFDHPQYYSVFLQHTNTRDIILRRDINFATRGMTDPNQIETALSQTGIPFHKQDFGEKLTAYRVPDNIFKDKIFTAKQVVRVLNSPPHIYTQVLPYINYQPNEIFITSEPLQQIQHQNLNERLVVVAEKQTERIRRGNVQQPNRTVLSTEELQPILDELPHISILPDDPRYFLVRLKEQIAQQLQKDWSDVQYLKLQLAGKRLKEIYILAQQNPRNFALLGSLSKDYEDQIHSLDTSYIRFFNGITEVLIKHESVIEYLQSQDSRISEKLNSVYQYLTTVYQDNQLKDFTTKETHSIRIPKNGKYIFKCLSKKPCGIEPTIIRKDNSQYYFDNTYELEKGTYLAELINPQNEPYIAAIEINNNTVDTTGASTSIIKNTSAHYTASFAQLSGNNILVFAEAYHPLWEAWINGKRVEDHRHLLVNGYANAWVIDEAQPVDIEIKFSVEQKYQQSIVISLATIVILIGFTIGKINYDQRHH
ncbi:MAG: hypothetical protein KatS3mg087_0967 [Patescibacteria group bacterium]|nr:MAG: hypothetical protein KatS3mg087_0967 [Patescibacteria group bacterium]